MEDRAKMLILNLIDGISHPNVSATVHNVFFSSYSSLLTTFTPLSGTIVQDQSVVYLNAFAKFVKDVNNEEIEDKIVLQFVPININFTSPPDLGCLLVQLKQPFCIMSVHFSLFRDS